MGYHLWETYGLSTPEDWIKSLRYRANPIFFEDINIHMNFIPKCHTTSLKILFSKHFYGDKTHGLKANEEALTPPYATTKLRRPNPMINLFPDYNAKAFYKKRAILKSVAFVRNPYHRLISCFRNKVLSHTFQNNVQHPIPIPQEAKQSFAHFAHFACEQPNHLRDIHFTSQWFHLTPGLTTFSFIGYCEHFSKHAHILFSELNASQEVLNSIDFKRNHSGKYNWKDYYDEELANLVYQAYKPDFEAFGYHKDSWKKDFEAPYKEPMRDYDPAKDIERFRSYFPIPEEVTS